MKTEWLRVMSPDAGKSDLVGTNRGFVFIPEEGDTVMVGFRYGDPNRPYVMGSMFNGTTGAGGSDANKSKSITTRSGASITIDDDEGKGKISMADPSGSTITLNGDETITLSAPKSISMNAKEINLNAEDTINITGDSGVNINGSEITETAETEIGMNSQGNFEVASKEKKETTSNYSLKGDVMVNIEGSASTNVKGGMVNLN